MTSRNQAGVSPIRTAHGVALAFVALLFGEVLYLTITLDTQRLTDVPSVWTTVVGWSPQYLRLLTTIALITAVLGGKPLLAAWASHSRAQSPSTRARAAFLVLHCGLLALFVWVSLVFFTGEGMVERAPALWAIVWVLTGAGTLFAWSCALLSPPAWRAILREHRGLVACATAVGTVAWALGFLSESFWQPLARVTYGWVGWMLGLIYPQVITNPSTLELGTPRFSALISPACSGYEGIGLIVAFLSVYLYVLRRELRFPHAFALLPLGVGAIWVLNSVRIVALIAIGDAGWEEIAVGGFHSQAGWLAFNAVGLGLVALSWNRRYFMVVPARGRVAPVVSDVTAPYLMPFLTLLTAAMVTGAFSAGFDWLYPVRFVVVCAVLYSFRGHYATLKWTPSWIGLACGVAAFALWLVLLPHGMNARDGWPDALQSASSLTAAGWLLVRTIGYVVVAPLAEELAFRGYFTRRSWWSGTDAEQPGTFTWGTFLLSSALFGAFHGQQWVAGVLVGMLFALALYRRRSIGDAVLAHATTNGLLAAYVFFTGQWSVWS